MSRSQQQMIFADKWNMYYHLPQEKSWALSSYIVLMKDLDRADSLLSFIHEVENDAIRYCMWFVMRKGISPLWEDPQNRHGGCFSYKVLNDHVPDVWKKLMMALCGETLTIQPAHSEKVNGITISPKKKFCVIKIWFRDLSIQDPDQIIHIENLPRQGCLFKDHASEIDKNDNKK